GLAGERVGVAWIYHACGACAPCSAGQENLCPDFQATGRDADGGYAEYMVAPESFVHPLPHSLGDLEAAPLLCAGSVGYRALTLCALKPGDSLGLTGFGASGHLVLQMARALYPESPVFVFARDPEERAFALELGADWAGQTQATPPKPVDAIIDTTPAWLPVMAALEVLAPAGRLVINAIRKESGDHHHLGKLDYERHLWREKSIRSVANVTRADVRACLDLAARGMVKATAEVMPLERASDALNRIRKGGLKGAFVLRVSAQDDIELRGHGAAGPVADGGK
ncbi:MAG: alcohol dehydrogenase catalytic domain-containing protein, partial [Xanthomonadales bacterium]|nr:alcohol dehydrogenase catalytic domain-containing protein [Xanthomonadales bacterium]